MFFFFIVTAICRSAGPSFIQFSLSCDRSHPVRRDAFKLFFRLCGFISSNFRSILGAVVEKLPLVLINLLPFWLPEIIT